jgi:alginate O-acetyltransferase complex protein AlgI
VGISFFTFQGISYVVDVWRRDVEVERSFILFAAYNAFFPQVIAGPIVRYKTVQEDFHDPRTSLDSFASGAARFMVGLVKKLMIADIVAPIADAAFGGPAADMTFATAWLGVIAYTLQIYFDFSGYSDMAIGLALMFGIRFPENFNHPYAAHTVTEFWRRWHISLSSWFRDYLYIPLGGNRRGAARTYLNILIVFAATGIWHGASWTFLLWGLYHGALVIVERAIVGRRQIGNGLVRIFYFLPAIMIGWLLFRAPDVATLKSFLTHMVAPLGAGAWSIAPDAALTLTPLTIVTLVGASAAALLQGRYTPLGAFSAAAAGIPARMVRLVVVATAAVGILLYAVPQNFSPFLYFRF